MRAADDDPPLPGTSALDLSEVPIGIGDQIVLSHRARHPDDAGRSRWVTLISDVSIEVIPEALSVSLLALGGLALLRRRRR